MRVLVCGSRTFADGFLVDMVLEGLFGTLIQANENEAVLFTVIEGGAAGADTLAGEWAERTGSSTPRETYRADWSQHGKAAGPIRNRQMLTEGKPDLVVAFIDKPLLESRGTRDMVDRALKAGLKVIAVRSWG